MTIRDSPARLVSLDQFRGLTVAAMFVVNFLGNYPICPRILRHTHDYCSFADLVMPQFLFAAGYSLRLSFLKHRDRTGLESAWKRMLQRGVGLATISIFWYTFTNWHHISSQLAESGWVSTIFWLFKRGWFQTLLHIAVTSVWILPVISSGICARVAYGLASLILHGILSGWFYFHWAQQGPMCIDGGPLGFLTWCVPALLGTWACDCVGTLSVRRSASMIFTVGLLVSSGAWLLSSLTTFYDVHQTGESAAVEKIASSPVIPSSDLLATAHWKLAEPPFVPPPADEARQWNYWMMSQRTGTTTYLLFSAGTSAILFAACLLICDLAGLQWNVFRTLSLNALAAYMLHDITMTATQAFVPESSSAAAVTTALFVFLLLTWFILHRFEKQNLFLRI